MASILLTNDRARRSTRQRREVGLDAGDRSGVRRIHHEQHAVGARQLAVRAADALGLDLVGGIAQAGGIEHVQRQAVDLDALAQHVAGGAGHGRDDRGVVTREAVEQARLAGVRAPGDHDGEPVAQQRALPGGLGEPGKAPADELEPGVERAVAEEVHFLLGEVDGGLDPHAQLEHRFGEVVHLRGELALQRAQRGARRLRRAAVDQIGDGLGLGEVELVVEERPPCELAGLGGPRAEFEHALQQQLHHHRPAVALQLEHVLAGERRRAGEVEREALVDRLAGGVAELVQLGRARRGHAAKQCRGDADAVAAGHAHDADAAAARGCGDRGDGVAGRCDHGCAHAAGIGSAPSTVNCSSGSVCTPSTPRARKLTRSATVSQSHSSRKLGFGAANAAGVQSATLRPPSASRAERYSMASAPALAQRAAERLRVAVVGRAREARLVRVERRPVQAIGAPRVDLDSEQRVLGAQRSRRRGLHALPEDEAVVGRLGQQRRPAARGVEQRRLVPPSEPGAVAQRRIAKRRGQQVVEAIGRSRPRRLRALEQ